MTTTKFSITFITLLFLASCTPAENNEKSTDSDSEKKENTLTYLEGYFLKNTIEFEENSKQLVLVDKAGFDNYFGVAKTMDNNITETDFSENNYAAIITKPSAKKLEIVITGSEVNNEILTVSYKLVEKEEQSYKASDLKIFAISKTIKSVDFVSGDDSKSIKVD